MSERTAFPVETAPMFPLGWAVLGSAVIPLIAAVRANRRSSLVHATIWASAAWVGWLVAYLTMASAATYLAVSLTGCAGVAVLGARRPGAAAWNFVVGGLLIVLTLPLAEAVTLDTALRPGTMRIVFLSSLLGVTVLNYLPTRLGGGAVLLGAGAGIALNKVLLSEPPGEVAAWCLGLTPWFGWLGLRLTPVARCPGNAAWRSFRDRYGLVWGLRLRDQFNRAAANARVTSELHWTGMVCQDERALDILAALTKRFVG